MQNKLRKLPRRQKSKQKSSYVGHDTESVEKPPIRAIIEPVTDSASIALYGERISKMYKLICEAHSDLEIGEYVEINGQDCKVVSILRYSGHLVAIAEMAGKKTENKNGDKN